MDMLQQLFYIAVPIGAAGFGWFAREIWSAVKDLKNDIVSLERELPNLYVRRDDFKEFREELMAAVLRIEVKLDGKMDKAKV